MPKNTKKKKVKNSIDIKNTKFLVTGGSGSFGRNIIKKLLALGARNILSISRNEDLIKQAETDVGSSFVKFKLGDITDKEFISNIMREVDVVFHTAAIKHVSLAEQNPREAYRSNVLGVLNVLNSSASIKRFVHISSDKAIGVTNCYGATKLLGEYLVRESNDIHRGNIYICTRCPNLLGSRGSVLDAWTQQLKKNNKIRISDPEMTRYFITLPDAADFIVDIALMDNVDTKEIYYPLKFTKKFRLKDLAEAFLKIKGNKNSSIDIIGASAGEKKHEDYIADVPLCSVKELVSALEKIN